MGLKNRESPVGDSTTPRPAGHPRWGFLLEEAGWFFHWPTTKKGKDKKRKMGTIPLSSRLL